MAQPVSANWMRYVYDEMHSQRRLLGLLLLEIYNSASLFKYMCSDEQHDINYLFVKTREIGGFVGSRGVWELELI